MTGRGNSNHAGGKPPNGYLCKICNVPGHYIVHCPSKTGKQQPQQQYNPITTNSGSNGAAALARPPEESSSAADVGGACARKALPTYRARTPDPDSALRVSGGNRSNNLPAKATAPPLNCGDGGYETPMTFDLALEKIYRHRRAYKRSKTAAQRTKQRPHPQPQPQQPQRQPQPQPQPQKKRKKAASFQPLSQTHTRDAASESKVNDVNGTGAEFAAASEIKPRKPKKQTIPKAGYVCHACSKTGHWVYDCPDRKLPATTPAKPPEGYVCKICNIPGHFIHHCPVRAAKFAKKDAQAQVKAASAPSSASILRTSITPAAAAAATSTMTTLKVTATATATTETKSTPSAFLASSAPPSSSSSSPPPSSSS